MERRQEQGTDVSLAMRCVARSVLRNIWIVLALAVCVSCISFVGARLSYRPTYTSSTTFVISSARANNSAYGNLQSAREMVPTFQTLVSSDLMRKKVSADMGLEKLPGTIAVQAVEETNLVTLSATASRPDTAFQMLKSLLKVYPDVGEKALGKVIMEIFDQPEYPTRPDRPFVGLKIMEMAFVISAVLAGAVLAMTIWMKDTVKTPDQARSKLDTTLFSVLYHEKKYKDLRDIWKRQRKSMLLTDPTASFLYEETLKKISTKLLYKMKMGKAQMVLITSTLPGEGKSTLAMNLAQDISHRGKKVLLIEGDLQQTGLKHVLQLNEHAHYPDWSKWLQQNEEPTPAMYCPERYDFTVLLNDTEVPQATDWLTVSDLPAWIDKWKQEFDVILVDAPPIRKRSDAEIWARHTDMSLLVVRQNVAEAKYINDSVDMLEEYGTGLQGCIYNDAIKEKDFSISGDGYGYGQYGSYGHYGHYGRYGGYGKYGAYGHYGKYENACREDGGQNGE